MNKKNALIPAVTAGGIVLCTAAFLLIISKLNFDIGVLPSESVVPCNLFFYGAVLLAAAAGAVLSGKSVREGLPANAENTERPRKNQYGAITAVGFGMLLLAFCAGAEGVKELSALTPSVFVIILNFTGAAVMCVTAFATLAVKEIKPWLGFMYSVVGVYFAMRGIVFFRARMAAVTFPEYLAECLTIIFGAVFLVMTGKMLSGNGGRHTRRGVCFWGIGAAVLPVSECFGTLIAKLFFSPEISLRIVSTANDAERAFQELCGVNAYHMAFPPYVHIALGIFAVILLTAESKINE